MDFNNLSSCTFKGEPVLFRRLSTLSHQSANANQKKEKTFCTRWLWYWEDNEYNWNLLEVSFRKNIGYSLQNRFPQLHKEIATGIAHGTFTPLWWPCYSIPRLKSLLFKSSGGSEGGPKFMKESVNFHIRNMNKRINSPSQILNLCPLPLRSANDKKECKSLFLYAFRGT